VANKRIKGKQCTIIWHVANLKISHASSQVVTNVIKAINNKYGQVIVNGRRAELVATRGKVHDRRNQSRFFQIFSVGILYPLKLFFSVDRPEIIFMKLTKMSVH